MKFGKKELAALNKLRGKYFAVAEISEDEQRNLLSWFLGYFYGHVTIWNHKLIHEFLTNNDLAIEEQNMCEFYTEAFLVQVYVAYDLLTKFSPKLNGFRLQVAAAEITKIYQSLNKEQVEYIDKSSNASAIFCSYIFSVASCTNGALMHETEHIMTNYTVH
jgi:hypothetical protein